jgi:hypothetical protein
VKPKISTNVNQPALLDKMQRLQVVSAAHCPRHPATL